jgi:hypothetical protein
MLLSTHYSALITTIWPDSGLTRNTRALGYRCSVPGLAGFTGAALCGARSLISCQDIADFQLPIADWHLAIGNESNLRFAMRDDTQQSVDGQMQNYVSNDRNSDRQQQRVALVGAGTRDNPFEWRIERIGHGDDKLNKARSAARRQ